MNRTTAILATIAFCAASSAVDGMNSVADKGTWPESWPKELEPLRKQSRTIISDNFISSHYEIPFTKREEFEAAWPHILIVKSKGAPIILTGSSPYAWMGPHFNAVVLIHSPPAMTGKRANPEAPIPGVTGVRGRWMNTTYIELIVDGDIVDLNRIPLPADTPIIDERFKGEAPKITHRDGD